MAKAEPKKDENKQDQPMQQAPLMQQLEQIKDPAAMLQENLAKLENYGAYDMLEGAVEGLENLNPEKRASRNIFLTENEFKENRETLEKSLATWIGLLDRFEKPTDMVEECKQQNAKLSSCLNKNLKSIFQRTKKLEQSYRSASLFFLNSESTEVEYLSVINTDKAQLEDPDSRFFKVVSDELTKYYDRLALKNNYRLLVIPGYIGSKQAVDFWGKVAHKNKVILVTDYKDRPDFRMLKESLDKEGLSGADMHLSNVIMTCNWLVGRKNYDEVGEEEPLFVPPAGALAGKLYNTEVINISQGAAGKKFGTIDGAKGTRLEMLKSEIASLIDLSMIPMVYEDNRVMAFSNKSLFNGNPVGLQEYSIVRVFDWIGKVFMNFFNDVTFQNWNTKLKNELKEEITKFLDDYRGPGKLIEDYKYQDIRQDSVTKDIIVEIDIKPFFAAKNFHIKLTGHEGKAGKEWDQQVE